jgi:hypothetical protein
MQRIKRAAKRFLDKVVEGRMNQARKQIRSGVYWL